ncbi:hypothetical protein NIES37_03840 [Tolypothrix tenuis PCC 7101]|uniref:GmrSD restriction endonucleases N-terminal domain-containing protein n=1 Tax=Tolypothrix tenuis PCC 7101 TaxID=231146 RepID=A0A1Z4MSS6_9CYAN|nr:DUF262 domain-containing protein [Aulosira sp. FACHB-113]BAY96451.1 hypothetical protein NIES37_03840 [Tolypothrix tenuis PCC 7101]BAZ73041.1 hypothetical protein NIES50_15990 [Aulosira laxa NIES-50]
MSNNLLSNNITEQMQEEAEIQIRDKKKVVDYNTIEYPIEVIVQKYLTGLDDDSNELFIPDYQRAMIWDEKRQSKFIESILLGLPIPYIFVADTSGEAVDDNLLETKDLARLEIIDGTQRIRTLARFVNNELCLQDLEKLDKLTGFRFSSLPIARQRRFQRTTIRMIQLTEDADEETRRDLFERINTGSVELNEMEKLRGIRRGNFLDLIDELAKYPKFIHLCAFTAPSIKRVEPQEFVLRFFAFLNNYQYFNKNINEFLDNYLKELNNADKNTLESMKNEFYAMIDFVEMYFPRGFRQGKNKDRTTTRIKFESLAVGITLALREQNNLKPASVDFLDSNKFRDFTSSDASSSKNKVIRRLEYVRDQILGKVK